MASNMNRFKNKAYLARPWKEYSKTVIMESYMEDLIQPDGWLPWMGDFGLNTCYYGEYNNAGPGSDMSHRVKWPGVKTIIPSRAEKFMPPIFFGTDAWVIESGVPYIPSLTTAPPPELATIPQGILLLPINTMNQIRLVERDTRPNFCDDQCL